MTNLEFYKNKLCYNHAMCSNAFKCKYESDCSEWLCDCGKCEFYGNMNAIIDALLSEHKEKIKLKHWEYDLLSTLNESTVFERNNRNMQMKNMGHFQGVKDTSLTIGEILRRREFIDD